jgi:hypothetical protein
VSQCPVETCTREIDTFLYVMCPRCWELVPKPLQTAVYAAWGARSRSGHAEETIADHEAAKTAAIAAATDALLGPQERLDV